MRRHVAHKVVRPLLGIAATGAHPKIALCCQGAVTAGTGKFVHVAELLPLVQGGDLFRRPWRGDLSRMDPWLHAVDMMLHALEYQRERLFLFVEHFTFHCVVHTVNRNPRRQGRDQVADDCDAFHRCYVGARLCHVSTALIPPPASRPAVTQSHVGQPFAMPYKATGNVPINAPVNMSFPFECFAHKVARNCKLVVDDRLRGFRELTSPIHFAQSVEPRDGVKADVVFVRFGHAGELKAVGAGVNEFFRLKACHG
jgi:hypothetical protein